MRRSENNQPSRKDQVGDSEDRATADGIHRAAGTRPHHRRDNQRGREGRKEPLAREAQVIGDAIAKDGREIEAGCPAECLRGAEHQDDRQAVARGHAPVANWLRARACAASYQRDMSSMAIHVAIELPNSA
jgi:hypothetical protein